MKGLLIALGIILAGAIGFFGGAYYQTTLDQTCPAFTATNAQTVLSVIFDSPTTDSKITNPITVSGKALGNWFFEGEFSITVTDASGVELGSSTAKAQGDWMSEGYVPFTAIINFAKTSSPYGYVIAKKNNPSGQPSADSEYKVKVSF